MSEAKASGQSARKQRLRLGTEITHCRTAPAGSRDRLWCAAVCTMRRPLHDGQTPLPSLHENATTNPGRSPYISPAQTRSRGCRIPNTDAVPSPPVLGCDALAATATGANSPETHRRSCKAACVPAAAAGSRPAAARVARVGKPTTVAEQCRWLCGQPWRESIRDHTYTL